MHEMPQRDRGDGPATRPARRSHAGGRDGLQRKAHSAHLPSFADRKAPQASHHHLARKARPRSPLSMARSRLGVTPLHSRPPCPVPSDRGRIARSAVAAGGSRIMRAKSLLRATRALSPEFSDVSPRRSGPPLSARERSGRRLPPPPAPRVLSLAPARP